MGNGILAITPTLLGQIVDPMVSTGVALQGVPWLVNSEPCAFPGAPREISINANRHSLQRLAMAYKPAYVLLLDSDVAMGSGVVLRLREALEGDVIAACAMTQGKVDHILTSCALMRWEHYELIRYWDNMEECQCRKIARLGKMVEIECGCYEVARR